MKSVAILILFIFISCSQNAKEEKVSVVNAQDAVEFVVDAHKKKHITSFEEVIAKSKTRIIPLIENTNFDSFIEKDDYNKVKGEVLKLSKIYVDFYKEEYNYKAIASYKVELSDNFYSVVVTVLIGDTKMESTLINYDLKGNIIDSKVISYDEIVEGFKTIIESRIEQDKLTINSIADMEERSEDITVFKITSEGKIQPSMKINETIEDKDLIEGVIRQLNLSILKIKSDLVVSKVLPHNPKETIVVIPEIVDEGEQYFELNSHILIVDNTTGEISHKYFESYKTNNWVSDAVVLREIKIDTAPYIIDKNTRAFGIRVYYFGMSKANPYSNKTISLFVKSGDNLKKVLHNIGVMNHWGEWDTNCAGEFTNTISTLIISNEKTNGYFDILVKNKVTETKNEEDENGDCDYNEKKYTETKWLKFNGKEYVKGLLSTINIDKLKYTELLKKATKTIYKAKKISDLVTVQTILKNKVDWFTDVNKPNKIKSITTDNGEKLVFDINVIDYGFSEGYSAYYPEHDIIFLEGGHSTDVCFSIKTGETELTIGNPEYIIPSPKNNYRLNGYFGGQECISYFFQKKEKGDFTYLTRFNGYDDLCTFKEFYWIDETQFIYSKMSYSESSENGIEEYFKGKILK